MGQGANPVCMMRTSWADSNALFLGFKAGSPSVNHGHMGHRLLCDGSRRDTMGNRFWHAGLRISRIKRNPGIRTDPGCPTVEYIQDQQQSPQYPDH